MKWLMLFFAAMGVIFLSIMLHELFHVATADGPRDLCFSFKDGAIAYVSSDRPAGYEDIAVLITIFVATCGMFAIVIYVLNDKQTKRLVKIIKELAQR